MPKAIRQLASKTAIYGMSTIYDRTEIFKYVPLYTRIPIQSEYDSRTEFMTYIAIPFLMIFQLCSPQ